MFRSLSRSSTLIHCIGVISGILSFSTHSLGQYSMVDVAAMHGISHSYTWPSTAGGGVSFHDFDNDGWDDLSFASNNDSIHFYQNIGGTFQRVDLGIGLAGDIKQILWVDQDNDGDKDLFVTQQLGENHLYENDGNMVFTDITASAGLIIQPSPSYGSAWGDINNDGYLDLYVTNRVGITYTECNYLYLNNGDDTFTNITWDAGVPDSTKMPFLANFFDYDRDGLIDLYIPQDKFYENTMFRNIGNNEFMDVSVSTMSDLAMNAMSGTVEDIDGNGFADVYMTDVPPANDLLMNSGQGYFTEEATARGLEYGFIDGWGANWLDLENDGDLDLHVVGYQVALPDTQFSFYLQNSMGNFERPVMTHGYDTTRSFGAAIGDFDNDGRVDAAVNNESPFNSLLLSNQTVSGNWLSVDLVGTVSNKDGVGGIIEAWVNGQYQARYKLCGESYISQNSGTEFFGFGTTFEVDSIKVIWPSGMIDVEYQVPTNQRINWIEGQGLLSTSTEDRGDEYQVRLFPQPASEQLHIIIPQFEATGVSVHDLTGKHISINYSENLNTLTCNTQELPEGLYFLRITSTKGEVITEKFMKVN